MKKYLLSVATILALVPLTAKAETDWSLGKFYAGLDGGVVLPQDTNVSATGAGFAGTGHFSYKDGYQIAGFVGYHFTDFLSAEGQLAYDRSSFDKLSGTITAGALAGSGSVSANGHISAFTGFLNGIITPFHSNRFVPYVGGGIGVAAGRTSLDSLSANGVTVNVGSTENRTDFAADGVVGFDVPFSMFSAGQDVSLGLRYQYLWVNSAETVTSNGVTATSGNISANIISARLSWKF